MYVPEKAVIMYPEELVCEDFGILAVSVYLCGILQNRHLC